MMLREVMTTTQHPPQLLAGWFEGANGKQDGGPMMNHVIGGQRMTTNIGGGQTTGHEG
jgi:hypothetical protein